MTGFPGYARIFRVHITLEAWTIENGLMTPTMKLKRQQIMDRYLEQINQMYEGH